MYFSIAVVMSMVLMMVIVVVMSLVMMMVDWCNERRFVRINQREV